MPAQAKALRSDNGYQLELTARVLPCRRVHPEAVMGDVKLIVDTGSSHTLLRRPSLSGVNFRRNHTIGGIGGHGVPAMRGPVHLVFDGQLVTPTEAVVIDAAVDAEDGVIGLDLLKGMSLHGDEAELRLAALGSAAEEKAAAGACGCWGALEGYVSLPPLSSEQSIAAMVYLLEQHFERRERHQASATAMMENALERATGRGN